ncbi:hypothetical protein V1286_001121 [Bradyrhizobium algeriense]|uniref:Uncharacterized protein n=1 Tax=Bradyrhizobium algeriense TaxID=634784 RepID=A0ABU8B4X9_9BRAD
MAQCNLLVHYTKKIVATPPITRTVGISPKNKYGMAFSSSQQIKNGRSSSAAQEIPQLTSQLVFARRAAQHQRSSLPPRCSGDGKGYDCKSKSDEFQPGSVRHFRLSSKHISNRRCDTSCNETCNRRQCPIRSSTASSQVGQSLCKDCHPALTNSQTLGELDKKCRSISVHLDRSHQLAISHVGIFQASNDADRPRQHPCARLSARSKPDQQRPSAEIPRPFLNSKNAAPTSIRSQRKSCHFLPET